MNTPAAFQSHHFPAELGQSTRFSATACHPARVLGGHPVVSLHVNQSAQVIAGVKMVTARVPMGPKNSEGDERGLSSA